MVLLTDSYKTGIFLEIMKAKTNRNVIHWNYVVLWSKITEMIHSLNIWYCVPENHLFVVGSMFCIHVCCLQEIIFIFFVVKMTIILWINYKTARILAFQPNCMPIADRDFIYSFEFCECTQNFVDINMLIRINCG